MIANPPSSRALVSGAALAAAAWLAWLFQLPMHVPAWQVWLSGLPVAALTSYVVARRRGAAWPAFVRDTADVHLVGLLLLFGLGIQFADGHGITTDGVVYFSQIRSVLFDHDLDVTREFQILNQPARPNHIVPIGPTPFWLPLYLIVAAVDAVGRWLGAWPGPKDPAAIGLGLPYVRAALLSSYAVGAAGLLVLHQHLRREFGRARALATTVLLFGATSLFWYMAYEASMTHAASFGIVAVFVVLATRWVPDALTTRRAIVLGAVLGVAFLTRPQEALFALYPAWLVLTAPRPWRERIRGAWDLARWAALGAAPLVALQLAHTWVLFTRETYALVGQNGYLHPLEARWLDTLFSSWHGFLSWTPVAYLAVLGTIAYLRRNWRWASCALVLLFAMAWVNGSTQDWSAGWAFGGRRFISMLVMLAPGLAFAIDRALARPGWLLAPLVAAALLWNHLLMVQYTIGLLPKDQPVRFAQMVRQQGEVHTRGAYVYPFAFPANLWFAWREGLPLDRYDLLGAEATRPSIDLVLDRDADRFLIDGWGAPGSDETGPSWWTADAAAVIAVPLDLPADVPILVELTTRARFDEPRLSARVGVEVNGIPIGELLALPDAPQTTTFTVPPARGHKPWRRGFNQIVLRAHGTARLDPADTRPPGPLARQIRNHPWPVAVYRLRVAPR